MRYIGMTVEGQYLVEITEADVDALRQHVRTGEVLMGLLDVSPHQDRVGQAPARPADDGTTEDTKSAPAAVPPKHDNAALLGTDVNQLTDAELEERQRVAAARGYRDDAARREVIRRASERAAY